MENTLMPISKKEVIVSKKLDRMHLFKIYFDKYQDYEPRNIKPLMGLCGLYFIFLKGTEIPYPFKKSRLIYIGMSEK
ncbi:MAG: hypothetical protein KKI06_03425, partial [Euryarchaeota archaeon]|nr:hypothetical protein [Euryarchaeota archaeon]